LGYKEHLLWLYRVKFRRTRELSKGDEKLDDKKTFDRLHKHKIGTPVGGGLLVILVTVLLSSLLSPILGLNNGGALFSLLLALIGFGALYHKGN
jgi:UDP-N-acetylmuramyl pentapeptide phosphotransferase/UDP-N-acetylglucosamine-1-phosphate transferase